MSPTAALIRRDAGGQAEGGQLLLRLERGRGEEQRQEGVEEEGEEPSTGDQWGEEAAGRCGD